MNIRLNAFKDRHINETCVIVANGPSLKYLDFKLIKKYPTFGLNKIFLGFKDFCFYPTYYVCVNNNIYGSSKAEIDGLNCVKFIGNRQTDSVEENALTYELNTKFPPSRFCKDISLGVREGGTVTYAALQIAYFMGFSKVLLVGLDHNYTYTGKPNQTVIFDGDNCNHFSDKYLEKGESWDNPDLIKSEESYKIADKIFRSDSRVILDATVGGKCQVFEKVNLDKI